MTERILGPEGSQRRRRFLWVPLLTMTALALFFIAGASAVHDVGVFQLDGNAQTSVQSNPTALEDWDVICKANPTTCTFVAGYPSAGLGATTATASAHIGEAANTSIFTTGGSKDPQDLSSWKWTNGSVPDKDDLQHAFAARYSIPKSTKCQAPATETKCSLLYFGSDRFDNSGDAQQGFWFFQNKVVQAANGTFVDAQGHLATHTNGDVLIVSDFSNGGTTSTINVYKWLNGGLTFLAGGDNQLCAPALTADAFCGIVNPAATPLTVAPWTFTDKSGNHNYLNGELYEGGINLSDPSINLGGECFSSFVSETRSSTSTTATLKDFILGQFAICGAGITISPSAVNEVGATHTFTVHVQASAGGTTTPVSGVKPVVTLTAANGAVVTGKVDNCASTGTDASGDCTVTFTSNSAGTVTGHAVADFTFNGASFHVVTDGVSPNSGDALKRFVDAKIVLSPLTATNAVNSAHTITATVSQDDGLASGATGGDGATGFGPAPNATTVTFSLLNNTAGATFVSGNTCTTTSGACTIQINSTTAGSVDIHATTTFSVGGVSLTRATGTGAPNSADANKVYVDAYITIGPAEATNTVGDSHTFTVTVKINPGTATPPAFINAPDGTKPTVTLTDSGGAQNTISSNTCANPGTSSGTCTVTFTSPTAGTVTGHATVTITVGGVSLTRSTDGTGQNSSDAIKHFVAGSISWTKVDNAGNPQAGATFDVCKTKNYTLPSGPLVDIVPLPACLSVLDNSAADKDPADGKFKVTGLSLGEYTVHETSAPQGFIPDPATRTVDVVPGSTDPVITANFVNARPILKITGFGYTNAPTGTPTSGIVSGTTTFTVALHNYGNGVANLTNSSLVVSGASCTGGNTLAITGTVAAGGNLTPSPSLTCTYTNLADNAAVTATLVVKSTTNGLEREASGSTATITFHVQSD